MATNFNPTQFNTLNSPFGGYTPFDPQAAFNSFGQGWMNNGVQNQAGQQQLLQYLQKYDPTAAFSPVGSAGMYHLTFDPTKLAAAGITQPSGYGNYKFPSYSSGTPVYGPGYGTPTGATSFPVNPTPAPSGQPAAPPPPQNPSMANLNQYTGYGNSRVNSPVSQVQPTSPQASAYQSPTYGNGSPVYGPGYGTPVGTASFSPPRGAVASSSGSSVLPPNGSIGNYNVTAIPKVGSLGVNTRNVNF